MIGDGGGWSVRQGIYKQPPEGGMREKSWECVATGEYYVTGFCRLESTSTIHIIKIAMDIGFGGGGAHSYLVLI